MSLFSAFIVLVYVTQFQSQRVFFLILILQLFSTISCYEYIQRCFCYEKKWVIVNPNTNPIVTTGIQWQPLLFFVLLFKLLLNVS